MISRFSSAPAEFEAELRHDGEDPGRLPHAVPTRDEVQMLLSASVGEMRAHLTIRLSYATGMRLNELVQLRYADIDWTEQTIFVREGKGSADRYVLVDGRTLELVQQWRGDAPVEAAVLGVGTTETLRVGFRKVAVATGLLAKYGEQGLNLTPHSLRHAFATHCFENGMDAGLIKTLLGHSRLDTTLIYIATAQPDRQAECETTVFPALHASIR